MSARAGLRTALTWAVAVFLAVACVLGVRAWLALRKQGADHDKLWAWCQSQKSVDLRECMSSWRVK